MRTTLDIADDVLLAAKEVARREKTSVGTALSNLARKALLGGSASLERRNARSRHERVLKELGIVTLPRRSGLVVTNELVNRIRDEEGI